MQSFTISRGDTSLINIPYIAPHSHYYNYYYYATGVVKSPIFRVVVYYEYVCAC